MDINKARVQREQLHVMAYLVTLRPDADSVRYQIIAGSEVLSLMEAHYRVFRTTKVVETTPEDVSADRSALGAARAEFRGGRGGRRGGRYTGRDGGHKNGGRDGGRSCTCFHCGQPDHFRCHCHKAPAVNVTSDASDDGVRLVQMIAESYTDFFDFQVQRRSEASTCGSTAGY